MKTHAERLRKAIVALSVAIIVAALAYAVSVFVDINKDHTASARYYVSKNSTVVKVNTDASVDVSQQETLTVNQASGCFAVDISNFNTRESLTVNSVKVTTLDENGQATGTLQLEKVPFSNLWRDGQSGPSTSCYAVDTALRQIYVFCPTITNRVMITSEYTIDDAITPYRDLSEKTWHLVEGAHSAPTYDASLTVELPAPAGTADVSENVLAWSHGPSNSDLSVSAEGVITYTVPETSVWQYADLRFDFPTSWLTSVPPTLASTYGNTLRLSTVQKSEAAWVDSWHLRSINNYLFDIGCIVVCLLLMLFALFLYFRHGRIRTPDFTEIYWTKPPYTEEKLHPSSVGQIWRWNRRQILDLHAALDYLAVKGVISVEPLEGEICEYRMIRHRNMVDNLGPIDQATLQLMMAAAVPGEDTVTTLQLKNHKANNPFSYKDQLNHWHHVLENEFDQNKYFEPAGRKWQVRLLVLSLVVLASGFGLFLLFGHPVLMLCGAGTAGIMALIANYLPRRTPLGNNITARAKALRNWLLAEGEDGMPETANQLRQVMPYACLFDLKDIALSKASKLVEVPYVDLKGADSETKMWQCLYVTALLHESEKE